MKKSTAADISIVVFASKQGVLLHKTLRSLILNFESLIEEGVKVQLCIAQTNLDEETKKQINNFVRTNQIANNVTNFDYTKKGLKDSINKNCSGRFIMFCKGDSLLSANFVKEAFNLSRLKKEPIICYPNFLVDFEGEYLIHDINGCYKNYLYIYENYIRDFPCFTPKGYYLEAANNDELLPACGSELLLGSGVLSEKILPVCVPNTVFFNRVTELETKKAIIETNIRSMKSAYIFCPEIFSSLEIIDHKNPSQNYPSKNQINYYRAKSSIKKNLIKIIPRAGKSYKYLQAQYNLNKRVAVQIKTTLKTKLGVLNSKKYIQKLGSSNLNDSGIWLENSGVSSEILKWWSEVNAVEPLLRPSYDSITSMHIARDMNFSKNAEAYYDFCSKLKNQYFNDVILCPHLIKGGADLAIIRLAKSLAKQGRKVLVISTSNTNSPWSHFLQNQQNIVFEEMSKIIPAASLEQQELFLMRVLQNWNIKAFTVINSYLGYKILWDYGNIIQKYCTVFLHTYAFDMSEDGYIFNMIPNGLVKAYDSVDYFVTDSAGYKEQLAKINGFDLNKIVSLYLPIESSIVPIIDAPEARKKVLWASRISTAKLVDVAVEVGKKLSEHGIELHFYGEPDPEYQNGVFESMIMGYKNIFYHGSYNGFHTIPYKNYDLFLMTSKNEGMPNVVLEASLANLYIVAPKVGGIPEIITNGVNGNLVVNNFEVEGYLKGVLDYYRNSDMNNPKKQRELNAAVAVRHSVASYDSSVIKLYTKKD